MKAAIIQARYGSSRFPGKVLKDLCGKTVLAHVIERCASTEGIDVVCCAIPDSIDSEEICKEALRCGAVVSRGSETDVLSRFETAAEAINADVIMRVTSDCPLTDPELNAQVLKLLEKENADYACNNQPPSWPHGLDCEVFTREALVLAACKAKNADEREHVTPWLRTDTNTKRVALTNYVEDLSSLRWTLDYPDDLEFFRAVYAQLAITSSIPNSVAILSVLERHPDITKINAYLSVQHIDMRKN